MPENSKIGFLQRRFAATKKTIFELSANFERPSQDLRPSGRGVSFHAGRDRGRDMTKNYKKNVGPKIVKIYL